MCVGEREKKRECQDEESMYVRERCKRARES